MAGPMTATRGMRMRGVLKALALAAALAGFGAQGALAKPVTVDSQSMRAADAHPGDWMSYGRTWDEQRFSPLKQIDDKNASKLGLAWYADLNTTRGIEGTPLVIDGVLYNVSVFN